MSIKLKKAYIEITNVCNLSCSFCPGTQRKLAFMSPSDFEAIIKKLSGITAHLYFHVMGEPLVHPNLSKLLALSADYGFYVNITTNGVYIKERALELLSASALRQVNFSLHSQAETAPQNALKIYLQRIFDFTDVAIQKGINISLRLWNQTADETTPQRNVEQLNQLVANMLEQQFHPDFSVQEAITLSDRITLRKHLYLNQAEVFQWPALDAPDFGDTGFCYGLRDQIGFLVDGTVVPCCLDGGGVVSLGNIFHQDLQSILQGERARKLYDGFSTRHVVEDLCKRCGYRTRFSR